MRRLLVFLIFIFMMFTQTVFGEEVFKITSVNFDTSNSLIWLQAPDSNPEPALKTIKLYKMENPKRAYFDIPSAIITDKGGQDWHFDNGQISEIKIGQFSTNPHVVRVVMYFDETFNIDRVKVIRVKNNVLIKYGNEIARDAYFQTNYRDEHWSTSDFYQKPVVSSQTIKKTEVSTKTKENSKVMNDIQQAFNNSTSTVDKIYKNVDIKNNEKEFLINSKYYINSFTPKASGVLIGGFGSVEVERPIVLFEPSRVMFDMPSTVLSPDLKNKTIKIGDDTAKLTEYNKSKARLIIYTKDVYKYIPIFAQDGQTMLLINAAKLSAKELFSTTSDAVSYFYKKLDGQTDDFVIAFNRPIVYSVVRENARAMILLLNVNRYNETAINDLLKNTTMKNVQTSLMPGIGIKITVPLTPASIVNCNLGADGRALEIKVKNIDGKAQTQKKEEAKSQKQASKTEKSITKINLGNGKIETPEQKGTYVPNPHKNKKMITIDAGHGGTDYGAIRSGINEKDINLDVAKRVEAILKSHGYKVVMTRSTDVFVSLQGRVDISEASGAGTFVSIHVNSNTRNEPTGIETHYYHEYSEALAKHIQNKMVHYIKSPNRGLLKSRFYVINHTTVPAILVEIGFISNDSERAQLVTEARKQATAKAIAEGIIEYLKN